MTLTAQTPDSQAAKIKARLGDQIWRLNNLYWITNEKGERVKFRLNWAQQRLLKSMWYLNAVLKARQLGMCLDPNTRVLRADLMWVRIADLKPGDQVVSVDEYPLEKGKGKTRKMRTATIQGALEVYRKGYRITLDDGRSVVCTGQHPWLSRPGKQNPTLIDWRSIESGSKKKLRVGSQIRWVTKPWDDGDFEDGWFGGMLDGEGSLANGNRAGGSVCCSQREGDVLDRMHAYLKDRGYNYRLEIDNRVDGEKSKLGNVPVHKVVVGKLDEMFRLIGQTRPARFLGKHFWEGRELPGKKADNSVGWATITSIEPLGEQTMIDLQTSTGTYIAEGLVSHNTTFIQIFILDRCIFNSNVRAGVIAHNKEDAQVFFRDKIKFAYDNLPDWLKTERPALKNDAGELLLANNSSVRVGTSMRSGTLQYLHVSEYGKICRKYPEKAKEIRTGAINAVHAGQFVFIESTAEGRDGDFFELCQRTRKMADTGKPLTKMDYKFHFFAWWQEQRYRLDPAGVVIDDKMARYFAELRDKHGIELDPEQKAWYFKKAQEQGDEMKREFPSTPDEAFEVAIEGAFYGTQMTYLRKQGRVCEVPWEPSLQVNTFWDLGMNDSMTIWFHQRVGLHNRLIDYYQNSGEGIQHYAKVLRDKGYLYGTHYMPHDIAVREIGNNGLSRKEAAEKLGIKPIHKVNRPKNMGEVLDGIESVRAFLMSCWIDEVMCAEGIRALDNYQKEWDDNAGTWKNGPLHNWASHGADALRTGATGFTETQVVRESELYPEVV